MFLSNRPTLFLVTCVFIPFIWSCGSVPNRADITPGQNPSRHSEFPFSIKEPETFQGNFFVTAGENGKKWFYARKFGMRRFDTFTPAGDLHLTELINGKAYLIDHNRKTYTERQSGDGFIVQPDALFTGLFRSREFHDFEDMGSADGLRKYRVTPTLDLQDEIFIFVDELTGLITRQEFYDGAGPDAELAAVYEVRDLTTSVEDSIFDLPAGYKAVGHSDRLKREDPPPAK